MTRFAALLVPCLIGLTTALATAQTAGLPPGEANAKAVVEKSPRHPDYESIAVPGRDKPVRAFITYPEVKEKAPVVIVIHEIFGLSDWIKGVTDQLAADGFIAIAPDFLSGKGPNGGGTESFAGRDEVTQAVRSLTPEEVTAVLDATREYAAKLPAANGKTATIGFCWGGAQSFAYATKQPGLNAAVVYYGTSPNEGFDKIKAPVLGLYGSDDARVNKTIEPAKVKMKELNKPYTPHIYDGAGHGFLRQQDGRDGANLKASQQAWPETVKFIRDNTK